MKVIKRDQAEIAYEINGKGHIALLFLHGSYNDQTYWQNQVGYFVPHYRVVTLDLPGHGLSGKERKKWSVEGFAQDVIALMQELDLKKVILIGHSLGALIHLIAATSFPEPVLGFIGIDFFKNAGTPIAPDYEQQADSLRKQLISNFPATNEQYARMALLTKDTSEEIVNKVVQDYRNAFPPMGMETTPEIFRAFEWEQKLLPQLPCTLHLIQVDYMPTNEEALKKYAVHGHHVLHMKGSCHFPMLENPDELNKLLEQAIHDMG